MIDNEKRRTVAARLRALIGGRVNWTGLQCAVFGGTALRSDTVDRLADLIEPGGPVPGETCELVGDGMPECEQLPPIVDRDALLALADRMAMMPQCDLCPVTVSCTEHADGCAGALMGHYARRIREACGEDERGGSK